MTDSTEAGRIVGRIEQECRRDDRGRYIVPVRFLRSIIAQSIPDLITGRTPEDDALCEEYGCEDRTHSVHRPSPMQGDAGECPTCGKRTCIGRLQYESCVEGDVDAA